MTRLPDLEAWAIFAKVAETGSFAKAAADLGLSQPTVSKALTRLEGRLKTTLFHRTSRRMSLTASGQASLERAARILAEGEAVESEVTEQSTTLRGPVRIAAPMSFGIAHLAPALPRVHGAASGRDARPAFQRRVDRRGRRGLRPGPAHLDLPDSSLLARRLCAVRLLPVASPAYFAQHGTPAHPRDLGEHRALRYVHSRLGEAWHFTHATLGEFVQVVPSALRVNNAEALVPALRAGLGIALQPEFLAWQDLRDGTLVATLPDWPVPTIALHIVTPPGRARPARVHALIEYLAAHFAAAPWAHDAQ